MGQQKQRNRRWVLASRPHGAPVPENFRLEEDDVATPWNIRFMSIPIIRAGLGRKLLSRLIDEARDCGKHVMVAGIESQNQASLHLHQSLGFVVTAQMPQVGTKFGRWLDLTFMQLQLDERTEPDAIG